MMHPYKTTLETGLQALNISLAEKQQALLLAYLALLNKWNKTFSLTAIKHPLDMVNLHLLDSLAACVHFQGKRVLDVGSGGGMPGIPLAILRPDWSITLLDSNQKKTAFLRQVVIELGLTNVSVVCSRVEAYQSESFDCITARAFADLPLFLQLSQHLLGVHGKIMAMKGTVPYDDITKLPATFSTSVLPLTVPSVGAERCLVTIERI